MTGASSTHQRILRRALLASLALNAASFAQAAGTPAGVEIQNTAQVSYSIAGSNATANSNSVSLNVAEIVNVTTTLQSGDVSVSAGASNQVLVIRVTNTGNGSEAFRLTLNSVLGGDDFDPTPATNSLYIDVDGSGTITPGDIPSNTGVIDQTLAADGFVNVLLVNNIPNALANGARGFSRLTAVSLTGTGAPGTTFAGQGSGGPGVTIDAVLGTSGGDSDSTGTYLVADIAIVANKSFVVVDPFGGARPIPGARIDYQVVVTATGSGTASNALFSDAIPANTSFVPASLRLNGNPLTDANDADAGQFIAAPAPQVRVALGNLTQGGGAQTVLFSVTIN
jgi:uncharacterized repeat protein (TIGR01451 family)